MRPEPTVFGAILARAVARTPGAIGGSLAARDGETVNFVAPRAPDRTLALITAHHGVLLEHARAALNTFHFGDPELMIVAHRELCVVLCALENGYFALLALEPEAPLGWAVRQLNRAAVELGAEMA